MRPAASWSAAKSVPAAVAVCLAILAACTVDLHAQSAIPANQPEPQQQLTESVLPDAPSTLLVAAALPAAISAPDPGTPDTTPAQTTLADDAPPCPTDAANATTMTHDQLKAEESQYIAGVVPNFNTVFGKCSPPLKKSQKLELVYHAIFVPFTIGLDVLLAGADEVDGSHNGYGWGAQGYFKRFGAEFADSADSEFIGNGVLPIVLHQDPRFFQLGAGHPVLKRVWHAALSDFICLGDNGHRQFNTSNVLGNLITGTISNIYYPAKDRGVSLTLTNAIKVTLEGSLGSQLLEFSPELSAFAHRVVHHESAVQKPLDPVPPR